MLYCSFSGAIASDAYITCSLCYLLLRGRTGFPRYATPDFDDATLNPYIRSDKRVSALITYVISTGFLSSICAVAILTTVSARVFLNSVSAHSRSSIAQFATLPKTYIFNALYESYSKCKCEVSAPYLTIDADSYISQLY